MVGLGRGFLFIMSQEVIYFITSFICVCLDLLYTELTWLYGHFAVCVLCRCEQWLKLNHQIINNRANKKLLQVITLGGCLV